jgi:hypothetical protein
MKNEQQMLAKITELAGLARGLAALAADPVCVTTYQNDDGEFEVLLDGGESSVSFATLPDQQRADRVRKLLAEAVATVASGVLGDLGKDLDKLFGEIQSLRAQEEPKE